ncbi:MAG: hypothetical protein J0M04_12660 [Verrucomicrobia bacterium]|nr:hypothetical protein [Verrucomicrobiota bacterium]
MSTPAPSSVSALPVRIAIPLASGGFCAHFGAATEFLLCDGVPSTGKILARQLLPAPPHEPGSLPRWLAGQQAETVVASAIGERALLMLADAGIEVRQGNEDQSPRELIAACLAGTLPRVNRENTRCEGGHHGHGHACQH